MIRPIAPDDTAALLALAQSVGFEPNELEELHQVLTDYFDSNLDSDHFFVVDDDDGLVGVAYYALVPMTDRTWNLYWIAIRPECQRQGRGSALLRYVEQALTVRGERLLLVQTSGLESFSGTRAFYRQCGYDEEARIRDYYKTGDDTIFYRKALTA